MPFHDNSLLFLTTSLVIQIYDLEHDSRYKRYTVFALKCIEDICCSKFARNVGNIAQTLPKVRKSAYGCSKCKIVLQTQKIAQKVLSAIGKGLSLSKQN